MLAAEERSSLKLNSVNNKKRFCFKLILFVFHHPSWSRQAVFVAVTCDLARGVAEKFANVNEHLSILSFVTTSSCSICSSCHGQLDKNIGNCLCDASPKVVKTSSHC